MVIIAIIMILDSDVGDSADDDDCSSHDAFISPSFQSIGGSHLMKSIDCIRFDRNPVHNDLYRARFVYFMLLIKID